jgi:hypothetical protein
VTLARRAAWTVATTGWLAGALAHPPDRLFVGPDLAGPTVGRSATLAGLLWVAATFDVLGLLLAGGVTVPVGAAGGLALLAVGRRLATLF